MAIAVFIYALVTIILCCHLVPNMRLLRTICTWAFMRSAYWLVLVLYEGPPHYELLSTNRGLNTYDNDMFLEYYA